MGLRQNRAIPSQLFQGEPIMQPSMRCQCALTLLMTNPVPKQRVYAYCMLFACVFDTVCFRHHRAEGLQLRAKPTLFFCVFGFSPSSKALHIVKLCFLGASLSPPRVCVWVTPPALDWVTSECILRAQNDGGAAVLQGSNEHTF